MRSLVTFLVYWGWKGYSSKFNNFLVFIVYDELTVACAHDCSRKSLIAIRCGEFFFFNLGGWSKLTWNSVKQIISHINKFITRFFPESDFERLIFFITDYGDSLISHWKMDMCVYLLISLQQVEKSVSFSILHCGFITQACIFWTFSNPPKKAHPSGSFFLLITNIQTIFFLHAQISWNFMLNL